MGGDDMVVRLLLLVPAVCAFTLAGCAGTWDTVSSQKFRDSPFKTLFTSEDPMTVLRTKVEGNERADAMRRLKEPKLNGQSDQVQDEALQMLATAATSDPSPIVRTAAIDALGQFRDPRAVNILIAAYHKADGLSADRATPGDLVKQVGGKRSDPTDPLTALGPAGFEPIFVTTIRSRTATALSQTNSPEAVAFLAGVAAGGQKSDAGSEPDDRDVRSAAVRGLGQMRSKEAVVALARVLKDETGRDVVLAQNAHVGLKELTGKQLPADPEQWNQVVQAGVEIQPEPNSVQRAINWVTK
jgi:HEAT repeat protein